MRCRAVTGRRRSRGAIVLPLLLAPLIAWGGLAGWSRINGWRAGRWQSTQAFTKEGVRTGCEAYSIGAGDSALLFVHGFADSSAIYTNMTRALAARGFACRAMLLPGFGRTPAALATVTEAEWKAAVTDEARRLRATHGHVWIVAHSLGATIALQCLAEAPDMADGLVLMAPLVDVARARSPILPARGWQRVGSAVLPQNALIGDVFAMDVRSAPAREYPFRDRFLPLPVYDEVFSAADGLKTIEGSKLTKPMLVVLAPHDKVVDSAAAARFFADLPAARTIWLAESGHVIPLDSEWPRVVDEIARFVSEGRRQAGTLCARNPSPLPRAAREKDPAPAIPRARQ